MGAKVVTATGQGRVLAQEILAGKLVVEYDDHRRVVISSHEVLGVEKFVRRPVPEAGDELVDY